MPKLQVRVVSAKNLDLVSEFGACWASWGQGVVLTKHEHVFKEAAFVAKHERLCLRASLCDVGCLI